jgi:hypothetical protein
MVQLCVLAVLAAVGGLIVATLSLGAAPLLGGASLLAAPAFGAVSLGAGLGATVLAMRHDGRPRG